MTGHEMEWYQGKINHIFVYGIVGRVCQTFFGVQPHGLDVAFVMYPRKKNPPLWHRLVRRD